MSLAVRVLPSLPCMPMIRLGVASSRPRRALVLLLGLAMSATAGVAGGSTASAAEGSVPIPSVPFAGSGGGSGTAAGNAAVAAKCNGGREIRGPQWFALPAVDGPFVYARGTAGQYARVASDSPVGLAYVSRATGEVLQCASGRGEGQLPPIAASTAAQVDVVVFLPEPYQDFYGDGIQDKLRVWVDETTGVAPDNDSWRNARPVTNVPFHDEVDSALASQDPDVSFGTCGTPGASSNTVWWRYRPTSSGTITLSASSGPPSGYLDVRVGLAELTSSGPQVITPFAGDECQLVSTMDADVKAGTTYLIAVFVPDFALNGPLLAAGGRVALDVARLTCDPSHGPADVDADGDGRSAACDPNDARPAIGKRAGAGAHGNEGTAGHPATSGSFTDADGPETLSIEQVEGAGSIRLGRDSEGRLTGAFTWSHTTADDARGRVTVQADDGEHSLALQSFTWSAANVAPVVDRVGVTRTGGCAVSLRAAFGDAGSADTHRAVIDWGDETSSESAGSSPVTGTHRYVAAGTYRASVTVTDDDGGSDKRLARSFTAFNTPSAILPPIKADGTSTFKRGRTVPVKIRVTGCDGERVTGLAPVVNLTRGKTTADVASGDATVGEVATDDATAMRWTRDAYVYNLSTKHSRHADGDRLRGTYTVSVSDPSFARSVNAWIKIRK